ncbi:F-box protein At3g07870-like [Lycium ferocissimum]|uniref:F-box protein At3g07870-like n=1 Tax=Lycium ferocissimum TaxID=112874 RepID=UPI002816854D|nr:F-box protein At3g07870-like [Lycium ferocissimum]
MKDDGGASEILALKSRSWRRIDENPRGRYSRLYSMDSLAFVHGAFHWIGVDIFTNYYVVSFSISNEVYGEIPFPPLEERTCDPDWIPCGHSGISVLGGLLCAYYNRWKKASSTFKVWVMKDYGVSESWTELFTIGANHLYRAIPKGISLAFQQGFVFTKSLISPKLFT